MMAMGFALTRLYQMVIHTFLPCLDAYLFKFDGSIRFILINGPVQGCSYFGKKRSSCSKNSTSCRKMRLLSVCPRRRSRTKVCSIPARHPCHFVSLHPSNHPSIHQINQPYYSKANMNHHRRGVVLIVVVYVFALLLPLLSLSGLGVSKCNVNALLLPSPRPLLTTTRRTRTSLNVNVNYVVE